MPRPPTAVLSRLRWAILYSEQGGCCAGCFKPLGEDAHVDHVNPLAGGGEDRFENLQLMHPACNQAKSDVAAEAWFRRQWRTLLACKPAQRRERIVVALEPMLAERLKTAAYWSRRSVAALIEEWAAEAIQRVEAESIRSGVGLLWGLNRARRAGDRGMPSPPVGNGIGKALVLVNGELFTDQTGGSLL